MVRIFLLRGCTTLGAVERAAACKLLPAPIVVEVVEEVVEVVVLFVGIPVGACCIAKDGPTLAFAVLYMA